MNSIQKPILILIIMIFVVIFSPTYSANAIKKSLDTQLIASVRTNNVREVKKLISLGANPFAKNKDGLEAVEIAIDRGFFKIAHYLQAVQNQKRNSITQNSKTIQKMSKTENKTFWR